MKKKSNITPNPNLPTSLGKGTALIKKVVCSIVVCLLFFSANLFAEKVRYVIDGDTVILEDNQHVRLIGIDAPEVSHRRYGKRGEPFGEDAKRYLKQLIGGKDVVLKPGDEAFDRFGRRLAYIYLDDGTFVNWKMVEEGFAETFRAFPFQYKKEFQALEQKARAEERGMWSGKQKTWWELFYEALSDYKR